jgi:protein gp37
MTKTKIEWTDATWNPVAGCQRCAPGCLNCYAEVVTDKLGQHPNEKVAAKYRGLTVIRNGRPAFTGEARPWPAHLGKPLKSRKPRSIFVNSMSDLFHEGVPDEYIAAVFAVMASCSQDKFVILTKRPMRAVEWFKWRTKCLARWPALYPNDSHAWMRGEWLQRAYGLYVERGSRPWPRITSSVWPLPNVAIGVSVSDQASADEFLPLLAQIPTVAPIVSVEPMLGPVDLSRWLQCPENNCEDGGFDTGGVTPWGEGISTACPTCNGTGSGFLAQVIIGAESGPGARPCQIEWVRDLAKQLLDAQVVEPVMAKCRYCRNGAYIPPDDSAMFVSCPYCKSDTGRIATGETRIVSGPALFVKQWPVCAQCQGRRFIDRSTYTEGCTGCNGSTSCAGDGTGQSRPAMTRKRKADSTPVLWVPGHGSKRRVEGIRRPT